MIRKSSLTLLSVITLLAAVPVVSDAKPSSSSGLSSRYTSSSSSRSYYSARTSSSSSYSRPVRTPAYTRPAPVYTPPVSNTTRQQRTYVQSNTRQYVQSAPSRTVTNNTTIINNQSHTSGSGGGMGAGGHFLAGAAGAAAGSLLYDSLTDRHREPMVPAQAPAYYPPQPQPYVAPPIAAPEPPPPPSVPEQPVQQVQPVPSEPAPQPAPVSVSQPAPVVYAPAQRVSGVGNAIVWLFFKGLLMVLALAVCILLIAYLRKKMTLPSINANKGLTAKVKQSLATYGALFTHNQNLTPNLLVRIPPELSVEDPTRSFVADSSGVNRVIAVGRVDANAHLYLSKDDFLRVFFGNVDGGDVEELYYFSRIETLPVSDNGDATRPPNGLFASNAKTITYANATWEPAWDRGDDAYPEPMSHGTETIQNLDHALTQQNYMDFMFKRVGGDNEYLLVRRIVDDVEGIRQTHVYGGCLFLSQDVVDQILHPKYR